MDIMIQANKNIKINMTPTGRDTKAPQEETGKISNQIKDHKVTLSDQQFMEKIRTGHSFTCCSFKPIEDETGNTILVTKEHLKEYTENNSTNDFNKTKLYQRSIGKAIIIRSPRCFDTQIIFGLDFDHEITTEELKVFCEQYHIQPYFVYETFSSTEDNKRYRLLFKVEETITDYRVAKVIQAILIKLFTKADKNAQEIIRIFFGTKKDKKVKCFRKHLDILSLTTALRQILKDDPSHFSTNMKKFAIENYMETLNDGLFITNNKELVIKKDPKNVVYSNGLYFVFTESEYYVKNNPTPKVNSRTIKVINSNDVTNNTIINKNNTVIRQSDPFIKKVNLNEEVLCSNCKLMKKFMEGSEWLYHDQLFILTTNLSQISGGIDLIEKKMKLHQQLHPTETYSNEKVNQISFLAEECRSRKYNPAGCEKCKYKETCVSCKYIKNPIQANFVRNSVAQVITDIDINQSNQELDILINKYNIDKSSIMDYIKIKQDKKALTPEKAYKQLETLFEINYDIKGLKIFSACVGLGKTRVFTHNLKGKKDVIVALKTHELCKETIEILDAQGISYVYSYAKPDLANVQERTYYKNLLNDKTEKKAGRYYSTIYKKYLKIAKTRQLTNDEQAVVDYMENEKKLQSTHDPIICTHAKLPFLDTYMKSCKTIIIDEDPSSVLMQEYSISALDLIFLLNASKDSRWKSTYPDLTEKIEKLLEELFQTYSNNDDIDLSFLTDEDIEHMKNIVLFKDNTDIAKRISKEIVKYFNFLLNKENIKYTYSKRLGLMKYSISYMNTLEPFKNIHIFSDTINCKYYTKYFPNKKVIPFIIDNIIHTGKEIFINTPKHTHSRRNINKIYDEKNIELYDIAIKNKIKTLTFKSYKKMLKEIGVNVEDDIHFGNCCGYNKMAGEDLVVLGNPSPAEETIILMAKHLGFNTSNRKKKKMMVNINGVITTLYTYEDKNLRELHIDLIQSELQQSVGRSRSLRNDCTVFIYAAIPPKNISGILYLDDDIA